MFFLLMLTHHSHPSDLRDQGPSQTHDSEGSIDDLDNIRYREIKAKAISGTLILLLKWFKRSREFDASCIVFFQDAH
jgi:hypothetical protein